VEDGEHFKNTSKVKVEKSWTTLLKEMQHYKHCLLHRLADRASKSQHQLTNVSMRVYPKVSGLATWSENCKWYSSLPLGAFCESV
jgi:hypothetical protein